VPTRPPASLATVLFPLAWLTPRSLLALGTVIVNLQRTLHDDRCALRVWAKLDHFFALLAAEMHLDVDTSPMHPPSAHETTPEVEQAATEDAHQADRHLFYIPYDADGRLDRSKRMRLDLREDALVRVSTKGAINYGAEGEVRGVDRHGHYLVMLREPVTRKGKVVSRFPITRRLGKWWVHTLQAGAVPFSPLVNADPLVSDVTSAQR
jgi:hypothetical protein